MGAGDVEFQKTGPTIDPAARALVGQEILYRSDVGWNHWKKAHVLYVRSDGKLNVKRLQDPFGNRSVSHIGVKKKVFKGYWKCCNGYLRNWGNQHRTGMKCKGCGDEVRWWQLQERLYGW